MKTDSYTGVYAALLTPRAGTGELDEKAFGRLLDFQGERGIQQFALNGATGEFILSSKEDVRRLCALTYRHFGGRSRFVCGIGSASFWEGRALLEIAAEEGATAALVSVPYFFRYRQADLIAWFEALAEVTPIPILLYNLPQFATEIEIETALALLRSSNKIVGVKDSSGSTEMLEAITRKEPASARIVGSDSALIPARRAGFCDAVISGVACVFPELVSAVFRNPNDEDNCSRLHQVVQELSLLATPWGLKRRAEQLGIFPATFAWPLPAKL